MILEHSLQLVSPAVHVKTRTETGLTRTTSAITYTNFIFKCSLSRLSFEFLLTHYRLLPRHRSLSSEVSSIIGYVEPITVHSNPLVFIVLRGRVLSDVRALGRGG